MNDSKLTKTNLYLLINLNCLLQLYAILANI